VHVTGKTRIVVAKAGLDGHDRGAKLVARILADAGFEVIYTGKFQTAAQIVATAIQESADAIGISILSGSHLTHFKKVVDLLKEENAEDIVVFGGGIALDDDITALKEMGVARFFTPGTNASEIVEFAQKLRA
jgi:methylmalonyl-CoA mutase C-terminal domain/subunit